MKLHVSLIALMGCLAVPFAAHAQALKLEQIANFDHQVTGVAVSKEGRIFVNFPRWTEDNAVSVAEVKDGKVTPYPNAEWNSWRNVRMDKISPDNHFVCVQSVVVDHGNHLWVVDPAAPGNERIVPQGPKLVQIDLATNKVVKTIPFDMNAAPQGSYLNDIRFSPDDKYAYLTDSGKPALIVVDLESGKVRRVLEDDLSTSAEKGVVVKTDGKELRRPDGRAPVFHADGLTLSADGGTLYWQALTGKTLYSIPTAILTDASLSPQQVKAKLRPVGQNGVADGLWMNAKDRMYITSPEDNAVKVRDSAARPKILVKDALLRWPDSFAEGPDGAIYVTASHIQDSPWFVPTNPIAVKSALFKITE